MEKREIKFTPQQPPKAKKPKAEKPEKEPKQAGTPSYGCLKNGAKPTFRQSRSVAPAPVDKNKKTIRHFTSFGKKNETVRILIKDTKSFNQIEKEKKKKSVPQHVYYKSHYIEDS